MSAGGSIYGSLVVKNDFLEINREQTCSRVDAHMDPPEDKQLGKNQNCVQGRIHIWINTWTKFGFLGINRERSIHGWVHT